MSVPKGEKVDRITVVHRISAEKAIRRATVSDIPSLLEVENRSFESDRLTRRNFNYLLKRGNAVCLVETAGSVDMRSEGRIAGYVLLLFNAGTSLARLYSFAVDPDFRRTGVAIRLLDAAEREAREHECVYIRLEVIVLSQMLAGRVQESGFVRKRARSRSFLISRTEPFLSL